MLKQQNTKKKRKKKKEAENKRKKRKKLDEIASHRVRFKYVPTFDYAESIFIFFNIYFIIRSILTRSMSQVWRPIYSSGIKYWIRHVLLVSCIIGLLTYGAINVADQSTTGTGVILAVGPPCCLVLVVTLVLIERFPGAMPTGKQWNKVIPDHEYEERGVVQFLPSMRETVRIKKMFYLLIQTLPCYMLILTTFVVIIRPCKGHHIFTCDADIQRAALVVSLSISLITCVLLPLQHVSLLRDSTVRKWHRYGFNRPKPPRKLVRSLSTTEHEIDNPSTTGAACVSSGCLILGVLLVLGGAAISMASHSLTKVAVEGAVPITKEDSLLYRSMADPTGESPVYEEIYLFNWTNYEYSNVSKPSLTKIGPVTFRIIQQKEDIQWIDDSYSIDYKYYSHPIFIAEKSRVSALDINIIAPNYILQGALLEIKKLKNESEFKRIAATVVQQAIRSENDPLILRTTVNGLLFGCHCNFVKGINSRENMNLTYQNALIGYWDTDGNNSIITPARHSHVQGKGKCTMNSGKSAASQTGFLQQWAGYKELNCWGTSEANSISGSDGFMVGAYNGKEKHSVMDDTLTRLVPYRYNEDVTVDGVPSYRYVLDEEQFDNSIPLNKNGFYQNTPNGVWNSTVLWGSSVFMSQPGFLGADPLFMNLVDIEPPNPTTDETYWDIEPRSGVTVGASINKMTSIHFDTNLMSAVSVSGYIPTSFIPLQTVYSQLSIPYNILHRLSLLYALVDSLPICMFCVILFGICCIITASLLRSESLRGHYAESMIIKMQQKVLSNSQHEHEDSDEETCDPATLP